MTDTSAWFALAGALGGIVLAGRIHVGKRYS
jgi:hypothetical protein